MINRRRSRAGIAQAYIIAGAVAAAAIGGYFLYKWYKSKHPDTSDYAGGQQAYYQSGPGYGGPSSGGMVDPRQMGRGGLFAMAPGSTQPGTQNEAPAAPEDTRVATERSSMEDPELGRLYAAEREANSRLMAALASGDQEKTTQCRAALESAQNALTIKKRSMY